MSVKDLQVEFTSLKSEFSDLQSKIDTLVNTSIQVSMTIWRKSMKSVCPRKRRQASNAINVVENVRT